MEFNKFISLSLDTQQRYLDCHSTLQGYIDTENRIFLYQVSDYYVESHYIYPEYKVIKIEAFHNMERLEPFLDKMEVSLYVTHPGIRGSKDF